MRMKAPATTGGDARPDDRAGAGTLGDTTWDTSSHEDFYRYYERQSLSPATLERFRATADVLLRLHGDGPSPLHILDVGCGAGAQAQFWLRGGHHYSGIDINRPLIELACERARREGLNARFDVGTATSLPHADASIDICLLPELLEHVQNWQACIRESIRVLRPAGMIYINTSSRLCPVQQEFNLPLYGWYPERLKKYFERRAATDWPAIANYAKYPAVNWFSFYQLRDLFVSHGLRVQDRFDIMHTSQRFGLKPAALALIRNLAPVRLLAHVLTPYTLVVARKPP